MSKTDVWTWDTTPANNTDVNGVNIAESAPFSNMNNMGREIMAQVRTFCNQGTAIASATTTNIAASGTSFYVHITGTTTITGLGTANAGVWRLVVFDGALTLTHNATSLILPGGASITTAANDCALFVSDGSGNWRCLNYMPSAGYVSAGNTGKINSTDAGATQGPDFIADRNSPSAAASDIIGSFMMRGRDSGGNATDYAKVIGKILDPTNGSEDGAGILQAIVGGVDTNVVTWGPGVQIGSPTGGDQGAGTLNVDGDIYKDGVKISSGTGILLGSATSTTADSTTTTIPYDNTKPQSTEGKEHLTVTVTPNSASSTLEIEVLATVGINSTGQVTGAIFQDSGADALYAVSPTASTNLTTLLHLKFVVSAASTTARTYKFRYGPDANTAYINRDPAGSKFGGVLTSTMTVKEYLP